MTQIEQTQQAKDFAEYWKDRGDEKQEAQRYWIGLLQEVLGVENPSRYIEFEKTVKIKHTNFIDGYISSTKVLIEQKGAKVDLTKPQEQSDGVILTPYQQAKRYADELPYDLRPRWIVVSNFKEIHIHDMNNLHAEPEIIKLENLEKEYYRLQFLVDTKNENIRREEEISLQAGILVGKLYDALIKEYINPDESSLRSLNILCVRLVFCFYAEDAGLFETRTSFEDYIKSFNLPNLRKAMIDLFKGLDTKLENRDKYDTTLNPFPYVNGGLFAAEDIEIPNFTQEIVDVLVNDCAPFDWREISPTIFGAVFESTLNPDTRRTGGMHYTSIENIHKVIDPLFMDELEAEFEKICATTNAKSKSDKLHAFQEKLGNLKFLDPACGSGNFLTETYLSIRRLENKVISMLNNGEKVLGFDEFIKVKINQFYGIEINDFAVTVAKTALWIAESQMMTETEKIIGMNLDFLPLTTNAFIVEGNALRMNWATLKPIDENIQLNDGLFAGFATEVDGNEIQYDYIMGNPPFVGHQYRTKIQAKDMEYAFSDLKTHGKLDYVCAWYSLAAKYMQNKMTKAAFVSTNSIVQGESVPILWEYLFNKNVEIQFAYKTFVWDSESNQKASVHCVIIGFNCFETDKEKIIFTDEGKKICKNINGYLIDGESVVLNSRGKPINKDFPLMFKGSQPTDGLNLILEEDEYINFIKNFPNKSQLVKQYMGSYEFINNKKRYCLWLENVSPAEFQSNKFIIDRLQKVKEFRIESATESVREYAKYPAIFTQIRQPNEDYLAFPAMSSCRREYIPIGYISKEIIASNQLYIIPNATFFMFGILTSCMHNVWMRVVCGRLKSDFRYAPSIYNNFPFPNPTDEQKAKIEQTAQAILNARSQFPEASLADLYNPLTMPPVLRKAHEANDKAVEKAYGKTFSNDDERVAFLFEKYVEMTEGK